MISAMADTGRPISRGPDPDPPQGIVILGAGGHARVLAEALRLCGLPLAGHVAPRRAEGMDADPPPGDALPDPWLGPWLGTDDALPALAGAGLAFASGLGFVDAAGAARRARILAQVPGPWVTICHPGAIVAPSAVLEPGVFVAAGAVVGTQTRLGRGVIVNTGAVVDHDCDLGPNTHVATGARLAGGVTTGADVLIGAGAVLRQGLQIGAAAVIGAGAVVIRPVAAGCTVIGNPARPRPQPSQPA